MTPQPDIELGNPAPPRLYAPPSTGVAIAASPNGPPLRRGARVVDWDGLENRCASDGTVGSNPTLSSNNAFTDSHSDPLNPILTTWFKTFFLILSTGLVHSRPGKATRIVVGQVVGCGRWL